MKKKEKEPTANGEKITPETFPTLKKINPLVGLPEYLKDRKNYLPVQHALLETLASRHSHSELVDWSNCVSCQEKVHDHAEMMRKLGFKSPAQYMAWKKTHEEIIKRVPLR